MQCRFNSVRTNRKTKIFDIKELILKKMYYDNKEIGGKSRHSAQFIYG